jgi:hypothetical protein
MRKVGVVLAVALVSAVQLSACSSSPPSRFTSLDPDKTFSSLTADERHQFCEDRSQYMGSRVSTDDRKKIGCAGTAGKGAGQTACERAYQACLNAPAPEPQSSCDGFAKDAQGCVATVDEATQCAQAQADALEKLASAADDTCKDLGKTSKKAEPVKAPAACAKVERLCPKLFDEPALDEAKSQLPSTLP